MVRFGLVPESLDFMSKNVTTKLVGQTLDVVELVEEKQPRVFNLSKEWGDRQATNHVTGCKSLHFSPSGLNAEVLCCVLKFLYADFENRLVRCWLPFLLTQLLQYGALV